VRDHVAIKVDKEEMDYFKMEKALNGAVTEDIMEHMQRRALCLPLLFSPHSGASTERQKWCRQLAVVSKRDAGSNVGKTVR
jgi:hypothetical protein